MLREFHCATACLQIPFVLEKGPDNPYCRLWSLIAMQYIANAVDRCVCMPACVCMHMCVSADCS